MLVLHLVLQVMAHNSPLEALAWNHDASLIASASSKGTVIRVRSMPKVSDNHKCTVDRRQSSECTACPRYAPVTSHFQLQAVELVGHQASQAEGGCIGGFNLPVPFPIPCCCFPCPGNQGVHT